MRLERLDALNTITEGGQRVYSPNNKPSAADVGARPASWNPTWNDVQSKPSQATRWPSWAEVTGKPSGIINQSAFDGRYLLKGAKAVDSDKLDGLNSTDFAKNNTTSIVNPVGGTRAGSGYSSTTGAIRIALPQYKSNTMITLKITCYDYTTHESFEIFCGGYNHSSSWINTFAYMHGNNKEVTVRFGRSATKDYIYIGEIASKWSHLQTNLTHVTTGYSNYQPEKWNKGWAIDYSITDLEDIKSTIKCGRQYTTVFKPTKVDVGLSNVPNFPATGSTTDSSNSRFAVAGAVKATMDRANAAYSLADAAATKGENDGRYLGKTAKAVDADKIDGYDSTQLMRRIDNTTDYSNSGNVMSMQQRENSLPSGAFPSGTYTYGGLLTFNDSSSRLRMYAPHQQGGKSSLYINTGWNVDSKARPWERLLTFTDGDSKYLGKTSKATDADKLDGINSTSFARSDADDTISGRYVFNKNYTFDKLTDITTAPIHVNANISQPSGNQKYVPSFHSNSRLSTGYVQHLSIGHKRNGAWGHGYFAIGGNDKHPTKEWLFGSSDGSFNSPGKIYESGTLLSSTYLGKTAKAVDSDKLDGINSSQFLRSDADDNFSGNLISTNRSKGVIGVYDSKKTDQIWSMGAAYKNNSSGADFGNLYGLAYKHTNNKTGGTMAGGHQMVWCTNGKPQASLGDSGIWSAGTVIAVGDVYEKGKKLSDKYMSKTSKTIDSATLGGKTKAQIVAEARSGLAPSASSYSKAETDSKYLGKTAKAVDADKLDGLNSTDFLSGLKKEAKVITVGGDSDVYYPVRFSNNGDNGYAWRSWNIARSYNLTAPITWNTPSHKGGLTLSVGWSGDSSWGGNDKNIRVSEFVESYTTMVGGLALSTGGLIVWLRGGNAKYYVTGPNGVNTGITVHLTDYKAADKKIFAPRAYESSVVKAEVWKRVTTRGSGQLYDSGERVYSPANKPTAATLGAITKAQGDGYYLGKTAKAATAVTADKVNVSTSSSTGWYGMVWNSGTTLYNTVRSGKGTWKYRPSDGYLDISKGAIRLQDNNKLNFGTASDANMFCDGSHLYLDLQSGINNFYIRDGGTNRFTFDDAGDFTATGNVSAYSDARLKTDVKVIPNALDKVISLRGCTYIKGSGLDKKAKGYFETKETGLIAQDVEKVLPEAVSVDKHDKDGIKAVAYGNMAGLFVEAIKELKNEVDLLKNRVKELEGDN